MNKKELRIKILQGKTLAKKLNDVSKDCEKKDSFILVTKKKEIDKRIDFYINYLKEIDKRV